MLKSLGYKPPHRRTFLFFIFLIEKQKQISLGLAGGGVGGELVGFCWYCSAHKDNVLKLKSKKQTFFFS